MAARMVCAECPSERCQWVYRRTVVRNRCSAGVPSPWPLPVERGCGTQETVVVARHLSQLPDGSRVVLDLCPAGRYLVAERVGFEPTVEVAPYNGFRDRRLRPLSHLSVCGVEACCNRAVPPRCGVAGTPLRLTSDRKIVRVTRALGKPPAGGATVSMLLRIGSAPTLRRETPMLGCASRGRACP